MRDLRTTDQLIKDGMDAMRECIVIPNHWLPEEMRDNKRGGRTLAKLDKLCDKREGFSEHKKLKAIKARNIEAYRKQFEETESFEYDQERDEMKLYSNQQAWCKFCPTIEMDGEVLKFLFCVRMV